MAVPEYEVLIVTVLVVELDSSKVQVILPPLSDAEEELHDRETVGVVDLPSVNVSVSLCLPLSVALVTDVTLMTIVSLPSVLVSDFPVSFQLVEVFPAEMVWVVLLPL